MISSSRILSAEDVISIEPFSLDSLSMEEGREGRDGLDSFEEAPPPATESDGHGDLPGHGEHVYREGYRDGFRDGEAQALAQCEARDQALGTTLQARTEVLMNSLEQEFEAFQARHADRVVDLALAMARQIVGQHLAADRARILAVVQEALAILRDVPGAATLALDPLDAVLVGERLAPLLQERRISVTADPGIEPGGCRLASNDIEIDATLATRWARLLAAMGRSPDSGALADGAGAAVPGPEAAS